VDRLSGHAEKHPRNLGRVCLKPGVPKERAHVVNIDRRVVADAAAVIREHLEKVLQALRDHDPWMELSFFLNANDRLNGITPLQALRTGDVEQVAQAAQAYGEQGAA
jgi:hypothetical protein